MDDYKKADAELGKKLKILSDTFKKNGWTVHSELPKEGQDLLNDFRETDKKVQKLRRLAGIDD